MRGGERMRGRWVLLVLKVLAIVTVATSVFGWAVMSLWNWLVPSIFGLRSVSFSEGVGLLALSWLLFGGWRGGGFRGRRRRMESLSPEEREALRQRGCGGVSGGALAV